MFVFSSVLPSPSPTNSETFTVLLVNITRLVFVDCQPSRTKCVIRFFEERRFTFRKKNTQGYIRCSCLPRASVHFLYVSGLVRDCLDIYLSRLLLAWPRLGHANSQSRENVVIKVEAEDCLTCLILRQAPRGFAYFPTPRMLPVNFHLSSRVSPAAYSSISR